MNPLPPRREVRADRRVVRATEAVWPVSAGAVTALGLVGSARQYGVVGLALIYLGTAVFAMVMVYAAFAESEVTDVPRVRIGLYAALALVDLIGVIVLFPIDGWLIVAITAGTFPARHQQAGRTPATGRGPPDRGRDDRRRRGGAGARRPDLLQDRVPPGVGPVPRARPWLAAESGHGGGRGSGQRRGSAGVRPARAAQQVGQPVAPGLGAGDVARDVDQLVAGDDHRVVGVDVRVRP